jgi:DNA-binding NarL/FixJ family response regulator
MKRRKPNAEVEQQASPATPEPPPGRPSGVILIEALNAVRAGLSLLISTQPDLDVLFEGATADEAMSAIRKMRRKTRVAALIGLNLGGSHDSFWLIRSIREQYPWIPILAMGAGTDPQAISRCLFYGADGFVDKAELAETFLDSLRRTLGGEVVLTGLPSNWLGPIAEGIDRQRQASALLTEREREVLTVAAEGLTARQIGSKLGLRERTVTTHLGNIYKKLGAGGRMHAVAAATRSGLVSHRSAE